MPQLKPLGDAETKSHTANPYEGAKSGAGKVRGAFVRVKRPSVMVGGLFEGVKGLLVEVKSLLVNVKGVLVEVKGLLVMVKGMGFLHGEDMELLKVFHWV